MDIKLEKDIDIGKELSKLQEELLKYKCKHSSQKNEIISLQKELQKCYNNLAVQETENESLRRVNERLNLDNDQLLQKFDSLSKAAHILEENENQIKEELKLMKEENQDLRNNVIESNFARDNVIEKLKDVSFETRELIDNCEKASEETKLFQMKSEKLEEKLNEFLNRNEYLQSENKNLQYELVLRNKEMLSLRDKLSSHMNAEINTDIKNLWEKNVNSSNSILQDMEYQIKTITDELNERYITIKKLNEEIDCLRCNNNNLQDQNIAKDKIILKQTQDFRKIKATVDDYHSEILRLDSELKDCHKRVSALNQNLETINSENIDLLEYTNFRRCLKKFGNLENIENLLSELQVLPEIEQFFEKKLTPHINSSDKEPTESDSVVIDSKQNIVCKIKNYLEKALITIEKLNDKMLRLRTEYENKLRTKSAEISTLREVLSNATLYNNLLEQALEQFKDNIRMEKAIENKTDELMTVNETLLDGFDEFKQLYTFSQRYSNFLCAKIKQINMCFKLLELTVDKWMKNEETLRNIDQRKINGLFFLIKEIFEEVNANKSNSQLSVESLQLLSKCEKNLITKDYLKSTVENMSLEVKRLTCKVEHEMAKKIQEIELLKSEMDNVRTDNFELVNKIKNCNREIVSLSTENYDLNEKLENIVKIGNNYEILNQELELLKNKIAQYNNENQNLPFPKVQMKEIRNANQLCMQLKNEYVNLKESVFLFSKKVVEDINTLKKTVETKNVQHKLLDFNVLKSNCREINKDHKNLKKTVIDFKKEIQNDLISFKSACEEVKYPKEAKNLEIQLKNLMNTCKEMRKEHNNLKEINFKTELDDVMLRAKSNFDEKLSKIMIDFNNVVECRENCTKNDFSVDHISSTLRDMKTLNHSIHSALNEQKLEFEKSCNSALTEIQKAALHVFSNLKSSFTSSNEEIMGEMQEINAKLEERDATISSLKQILHERTNEKVLMLENLKEKEEIISKTVNNEKILEEYNIKVGTFAQELEKLHKYCLNELDIMNTNLKNVTSELENLNHQIECKDELIKSLENEIAKHKDGDVCSVGTISRAEEVSRLNDVEESFEEKYTKLRYLALKMKKNIAGLNEQLNIEKTEKMAFQNKLSVVAEQAKMSQVLQEECEKLTDQVELHRCEIKKLNKIILESDKLSEDLKFQCAELSKNLESTKEGITSLQNEKNENEMKLKNLTMELENIKKEKFAEEIVKKEKDKEFLSLKQKLRDNEEIKKKIQNDLDQAKLEARKQGALILEMRDYEKTISDLTTEIQEKKKNIQELGEKLTVSFENNISLTERIKELEGQMESYATSNKKSDEQLLNLNKIVNECENNIENLEQRLKQTQHHLESERGKNENLIMQLATSSAELKSLTESCHSEEKHLNEQVKSLQIEIINSNDNMKKKETEFNKLKDDFEAYKIRAHSVIQKLKIENCSKNNEEKLQSEIDVLSHTVKKLRKQLDCSLTEIEHQKTENNLLKTTKESLLCRIKELSETITEKTKELDVTYNEHRMHKLNTDTLINCYKAEIEKLKVHREILSNEVDKTQSKKEILNTLSDEDISISENNGSNDLESVLDYQSEHNLVNNLQESEIEAIEETERYRKLSKRSIIPLEKLLENDLNESRNSDGRPENEVELRQSLNSLEQQVKYLTGILNESEKNAARNEQQVTFLKEEIRRLQRMLEREPHLQNTEYLKNVLIKFITLPVGDEKTRLITVLETILKLTPQEKQTLSGIAKGYRVESKQAAGWTSYLGWS